MDALALELVKPAPDASTLRRLVLEDCERPLTVQQRRKLWTVLLRVADRPTRPCDDDAPVDEERVLDADVRRTRRAECVTDAAQQDLRSLLRRFCASRGAPYRQGLNELAAPFSLLAPVDDELHALFDAFVSSFAAAFYASGSASTNRPLLRACGLFSALANYHDPELSHHLCSAGFSPALYATPWFLTLMARAAPDSLGHVLHIFDAWIALDDAGGVFYGSLALLRAHRSKLLEAAPSRLPHVFASLQLIGGASLALSAVVSEARALREATPHCLRGALKKALLCDDDARPQSPGRGGAPSPGRGGARRAGDGRRGRGDERGDDDRYAADDCDGDASDAHGVVMRPAELFESMAATRLGRAAPRSILRFVVVDVTPPDDAAHRAAGYLAGSVTPLSHAKAGDEVYGGLFADAGRAGLARWAKARICADAGLRGRHLVVVGADVAKRRRRDALLALVHSVLREPGTPGRARGASFEGDARRRGREGDSDDDAFRDGGDDLEDDSARVDGVALRVSAALIETSVPRVSTLEVGGFAALVDVAVRTLEPAELRALLPQFDAQLWAAFAAKRFPLAAPETQQDRLLQQVSRPLAAVDAWFARRLGTSPLVRPPRAAAPGRDDSSSDRRRAGSDDSEAATATRYRSEPPHVDIDDSIFLESYF